MVSFALSFLSCPLTLFFVISSALFFAGSSVGSFSCSVFLRGPPFEPFSSCSLRDLTRKFLFVVSLATVRRVGELQAVSAEVSSGGDLFLTYLPEFRAKAESEARPLPRSFRVRSLADFVGDLPDELLLCPVRALRCYLSRTVYFPSRPRSFSFLFVLLLVLCRKML